MLMFHSIRWRLVASYLFLTVLTVAVVGVLALSLVKRYTDQQEVDYLQANAEAIARRAELLLWLPDRHFALQELAQTAAFLGNAQVKILDDQQRLLADSGPQTIGDRFIWIAAAPPGLIDRPGHDVLQFRSADNGMMIHPLTIRNGFAGSRGRFDGERRPMGTAPARDRIYNRPASGRCLGRPNYF
jgi:hypothetical protein